MAENIIRQDIVQLMFETNLKELNKLKTELDGIKKKVGGIDDEPLDDMGDSALGANKHLNKMNQTLKDIGKNSAKVAFNGLKKIAGLSFKGMAVGIGAAVGAVGTLSIKSVQAYADYEQLIGGVQTLFKEAAPVVQKNANDAFKSAGLSANEYMDTVTSFSASLISSLGGDTALAAELANTAIVDMADNANKMGTDMESIQYAYQGFAKQNYTMLDNLKLGYGGTKEEMQRLVKDAAALTDVQQELGISVEDGSLSYANIVKAIHVVQRNMDIMGTTQKEAEGTISGSLAMVKSSWENLMPALIQGGDRFDQCIDNLLYSAEKFVDNAQPALQKALEGIGRFIEVMAPKLEEQFPKIMEELLPPLIRAASNLFAGLIRALPTMIRTVKKEIPNVIKEIAAAIYESFTGVPMPEDTFTKIEGTIKNLGNTAKWAAPIILGLVGAFKGLKAIKSIRSALGSLGSAASAGGQSGKSGGIFGVFHSLANMKITTVLKGIANLSIIIGALGALVFLATKLFKGGIDLKGMLQVAVAIGVLGLVGTGLSKLAGIVGMIPVSVVAKGLANMAIIIGGLGTLLWVATKAFPGGVDFKKMLEIVALIGVLAVVGGVLSAFAALIGLIPIPVVALGLANIALVLVGLTAVIAAFGALNSIPGLSAFIDKGGELLSKIFNILGELVGSLVGGLAEGVTNSLPQIGENLSAFAAALSPMLSMFQGVNLDGAGSFFSALGSFLLKISGKGILELFSGKINLGQLGEELGEFASRASGFFSWIATVPENGFSNATRLFDFLAGMKEAPKEGGLWQKIAGSSAGAFATLACDLETFATKAGPFFAAVDAINLENLNGLWSSLKSADEISGNVSRVVDNNINDIVSEIKKLPKQMASGIRSGGSELASALVSIWEAAVRQVAVPINKLIGGANWVLQQFGSSKKIASWTPYAKGTNGHKGGNALVNDGTGAELVQMPNGKAFIPRGKNILIPNAPKGMKVLPAEETARLMGKRSPTFRYENGTGDFDIWQFMGNPKGLVNAVTKKFVSYGGISGIALHISKSMVSTIADQMTGWAEKLFEQFGAKSISAYDPSKGVEQWRSTVIRALQMEGVYSAENVARTLFQMQTESGGNPRAINLWDSNAKRGTPSKGLMQVIDPTFQSYARPGFNRDIWDPLSNILASIRYALSRYGSLTKAFRGVGYADGGLVTKPGWIGEAGNEMVIPLSADKRRRAASLWYKTGEMLGYTPENSISVGSSGAGNTEYNTYAPQFNLTIGTSAEDRAMERKVKRWIQESMDEVFDSMARRRPRLREV